MYRQRSKPAAAPAEVRIPPLSTKSTPASTSTSGYRRESSLAAAQCVVARRPFRRPAAARVKAPTQIEAILVPPSAAARNASSTSSDTGAVGSASPGTMIVSAPANVAFTAMVTFCAYKGLRSYNFIGVGWLLHTGWDVLHHLYGDPIVPFAAGSSFGCAICDPVIALWCFVGALSVYDLLRRRRREEPGTG